MFKKLLTGFFVVSNLLSLSIANADAQTTVANGYNAAFIRQAALYSEAFNKLLNEQPQLRNRMKNVKVVSDLRQQFNLTHRSVEFDFGDDSVNCVVTYNVYFKDVNTLDNVQLGGARGSCETILDIDKLFKR